MNPDADYVSICVYEPEKTYHFLLKHLRFSKCDNMTNEKQEFYLCNDFNNHYALKFRAREEELKEIIINTDDCLRDYLQLGLVGIKFEKKPQYTAYGLEVDFTDDNGNKYRLLEQRNYSE
jgi:hypothetical protein